MKPLIRSAQPADIPALVGLLQELFALEQDFAFDADKQAQGLDLLLQSNALVLVAEAEGQVWGMVSLQILLSTAEGGPVGLLEDLVVTEKARGLGIGQALLQELTLQANKLGLLRLQLLADRDNQPALHFYQQQGWVRTQLVALRKALP